MDFFSKRWWAQREIDSPRPGFAQGSRRQRPAIAQSPVIEDAQCNVVMQGVMLQAVITDHHLNCRVCKPKGFNGLQPSTRHRHRHLAPSCQEQGFITHILCRRVVLNHFDMSGGPTMSA